MGQQRGCDPLLDFPENFDDMETSAPPTPTWAPPFLRRHWPGVRIAGKQKARFAKSRQGSVRSRERLDRAETPHQQQDL